MRYEWQYHFTSRLLHFEKVTRFGITLHKGRANSANTIEGTIEIRPDPRIENKTFTSGQLAISIPFSIEEGTQIAHQAATHFAQNMAFEFGDFQIDWALLTCERIPETPTEIEEVGELTHHILRIALQQVPEIEAFYPESIGWSEFPQYNQILLRLFNDAELKADIIDRYLTRFKILETEFIKNDSKIPAKQQLKSSRPLYDIFKSIATVIPEDQTALDDLIDKLVDARGNCAHLKNYSYGFLPGDQRLRDLELLELDLRELCRALIKAH